MTHFTQRNLNDIITYWPPASDNETNEYGHTITKPAKLIKGRWEAKIQQVRKPTGQEVTSMTQVLVDRELEVGGYLKKGNHDDVTVMPEDAQEIQSFSQVPDLRSLGYERRAFL